MCGVRLTLEDAGPLVYYPGTHKSLIIYNNLLGIRITGTAAERNQRIDEPVWEALVATHGIEPRYFCPRKGEALIWLANLLHGGAPQRDPHRIHWSQGTRPILPTPRPRLDASVTTTQRRCVAGLAMTGQPPNETARGASANGSIASPAPKQRLDAGAGTDHAEHFPL
jgi:hypothetical protein